jgi:methylglutaconyl-CoA hydratase
MATNKLILDINARGVAGLTLSRPERGNALDEDMLTHLVSALQRVSDDAHVRVIVLRGEGRHFCTGADVAEIKNVDDILHAAERISIATVCALLNSCPKPTIAVVHGACLGGGAAIAACCDAVLATNDAFFAIPEVRLGFAPMALMPYFLAACGPRFLRRYLLTGERFGVERAVQIGLVSDVRTKTDLDAALADLVESFLLAAPTAVSIAKSALRAAGTVGDASDQTANHVAANHRAAIEEAREGAASFREKRHPNWYPPSSP